MADRRRVAYLSYDFREYSLLLAAALGASADVLLVVPADFVDGVASPPGVTFAPFRRARLRQPVGQLRAVWAIHRAIRRFRPDVIHLQHGQLWLNPTLVALRGIPLVVTVHDPTPHSGDKESRKTPVRIMQMAYRRAARLIVHGETLRDSLVRAHPVDAERVAVIPHIRLGNEQLHAEIGEAGDEILFFGRIWEYKGLEYLIRAQPAISAAVPGARFVIAGRGEDFERYQTLMVDPTVFEVHNEYISDDQAAVFFRRASVVVLPYTDASQSGVIALACTYGKPVVATDVGALSEAVEHGVTGLLIAPRDVQAIVDAVVALLGDDDRRGAMGRAAKQKSDRECAPDVIAAQTLAVYRDAIGHG